MLSSAEMLGSGGPFAECIDGFVPRAQQQQMAGAVASAIEARQVLVCEAGTGTGKTLAYLVPALLSAGRVIISTGTRNLQEQLYHRDLPLARATLKVSVTTALLKGRSNYLCLQRLEMTRSRGYLDPRIASDLERINVWAGQTKSGDIAEATDVSEDAQAWRYATSTVENCLGQNCPHYARCHVLKARRAAMEADLVVVNHHLFFADMVLREEGFGELLPGVDTVVLDEAHQLPEVATSFFGTSLSAAQLFELVADSRAAYFSEAGDVPDFDDALSELDKSVRDFRLALGTATRRAAWQEFARNQRARDALQTLHEKASAVDERLSSLAERGKALESCYRRGRELCCRLELMLSEEPHGYVAWIELHARGFVWRMSPLEIAETFAGHVRDKACAWILTSATLAVNNRLEHFAERLGLVDFTAQVWSSPFDFRRQSLCYVPESLPQPRDPQYVDAVVAAVLPVLEVTRGRAFLLFTSHSALRSAAARLKEKTAFALLVQGSAPRDQLLRRFRVTPNSVLLGTSSFWEGVDVRGEALSCVVIDKLPFAAPDDPLLQARLRAYAAQGKDPFMHYQLPQAIIALKQGVGRLIRDVNDCGVLMLCDPRLFSKPYGAIFLRSIPPMPVTRSLSHVQRFVQGGMSC